MTELWKPINDKYSVSSQGRVRNDKKGTLLSPAVGKVGYQVVHVEGKKGSLQYVHRLVAAAFLTIDPVRTHVNHKDGIKTNNNAWNLEWCTHRENMQHASETGLILNRDKSVRSMLKVTRKPVEQVSLVTGEVINTYASLNECMRKTGLGSVRKCVVGEQKATGGFAWRYVDRCESKAAA